MNNGIAYVVLLWIGSVWVSLHSQPLVTQTRFLVHPTVVPEADPFEKSLRYNVYVFTVSAPDTGAVREMRVRAQRGQLLLTSFRIRVDGTVLNAEVADLDGNRFPELYVYTATDGSGSFGRVYAWQFMPERLATITPVNWSKPAEGYMGHDSLWVEPNMLCRKFPVYKPGDANAQPSGGAQMMRYYLRPVGTGYVLAP